jgi:hypothetical protein
MKSDYYNNIGIGIISLAFILKHSKKLSVSKTFLIMPFISHSELLGYLGRKTTIIKSIEKIIIDKTSYFSNFNRRFYDSLSLTMNSIQYLYDLKYIHYADNEIVLIKPLEYSNPMGRRAEKIYNASKNISNLLNEDIENLYLNLRIEL